MYHRLFRSTIDYRVTLLRKKRLKDLVNYGLGLVTLLVRHKDNFLYLINIKY